MFAAIHGRELMVMSGFLGAFLFAGGFFIIRLALKPPKPPDDQR